MNLYMEFVIFKKHFLIYVCLLLYVKRVGVPWRAEEGIRSPGAKVMCGCEPPNMGDRN